MNAYHKDARFPLPGNWRVVTPRELEEVRNSVGAFVIEAVLEESRRGAGDHETAWCYRDLDGVQVHKASEHITYEDMTSSVVDAIPLQMENYTVYTVKNSPVGYFYYLPA